MDVIQKLNCINGASERMLLIIEPWAEEYWIEPGMSVEVVGLGGNIDGYFEAERFDQGMIIYGWEGCVVSVFKDGKVIEPSLQE